MSGPWSPRLVEAYLADAAEALRSANGSEFHIIIDDCPAVVRQAMKERSIPPATADAAAQPWDHTLAVIGWLRWLDEQQQQIAWHRAAGVKWKAICQQIGIDRTTAWRRWTYAMVTITAHLNAAQDSTLLQHQNVFHSDSEALSSQHAARSDEHDAR